MMNNSGPRYKRSRLERQLNTDVLWCVLLLVVMCLTAAIGKTSSMTTGGFPGKPLRVTRGERNTSRCTDLLLRCLAVFQVTASG